MEVHERTQKNCSINSSFSNLQQNLDFDSSQSLKVKIDQKRSSKQKLKKSQRLFREMIGYLADKYFISMPEAQFQMLIKAMGQFKIKSPTLKFWRQISASLFYFYYSDVIKIHNTKQFCVMNDLENKIFNKRYKKICYHFKRDKEIFHSLNNKNSVKKEQNQMNSMLYNNFEIKEEVKQNNKKIHSANLSAMQILDLIYDDLFRKPQFQQNRRQIITKIAEISNRLDDAISQFLGRILANNSRIIRLLYIVFYKFKKYGAQRFYLNRFKNVVQIKLHTKINKQEYFACQKIFEDYARRTEIQEDTCKQQLAQSWQASYHYF